MPSHISKHNERSSNPVFGSLGTTIFTVMSALAAEHGAINLGQGFPDEDGCLAIRERAAKALIEGPNQYPPMHGLMSLRQAIADHDRRFYGLAINPDTDVVVTSGGTEALAASILALAGPGDEVVLIEPAYDAYRPIAQAAGAAVKSITLSPPDWRLVPEALSAVVSERTRVILLNTPLNPIGRCFDRKELEGFATVLRTSRAVAICDEVYEHLVFDGVSHVPLASLPGMSDRVVRIGSAGKMFSLTGWKVGWVTGGASLVDVVAKAHQFLTFTTAPALQNGVAYALDHEMDFTLSLTKELQSRRDLMANGLVRLGFGVLPCQGTYFLTADIRALTDQPDRVFCEHLVRKAGVALIPLSVFFEGGKPDHLVRFAFCKSPSVLEEALSRLERYLKGQHRG